MGNTIAEVAVHTVPCCCNKNTNNQAQQQDVTTELMQLSNKKSSDNNIINNDNNVNISDNVQIDTSDSDSDNNNDNNFNNNNNDNSSDNSSDHNSDQDVRGQIASGGYLKDPSNAITIKVRSNIKIPTKKPKNYNSWINIDNIYKSYSDNKDIDQCIKLRDGLVNIVLDKYTVNELFQSVDNILIHLNNHTFRVSNMVISSFRKKTYKCCSLPFYDKPVMCDITNECDKVASYKCHISGDNQPLLLSGDDKDRCYVPWDSAGLNSIILTQYISVGLCRFNNPYYKCQFNISKYRNYYLNKYNNCLKKSLDIDEISLIAFNSYGIQYTSSWKYDVEKDIENRYNYDDDIENKKNDFLTSVRYISDVTFLSKYNVRNGYKKYGALAYFNSKLECIGIKTSWDNKVWLKPNQYSQKEYLLIWNHAKWIYKVSITIASYLYEWCGKQRFVLINSFIKSIHKSLPVNHPIRRLFKPFIYGSISSNNHFLNLLREYSLFHRIFAFEYKSLCKLFKDSMDNYRFIVFTKKFKKLQDLPENSCPAFYDVQLFWNIIYKFITDYFNIYYALNKYDNKLENDKYLKDFYENICAELRIKNKYRFKRGNLIKLITHFICIVTVYNKHLNQAISFNGLFQSLLYYGRDHTLHSYTGLVIRSGHNIHKYLYYNTNDILSYINYIILILNNGIKEKNFNLFETWSAVILNDNYDATIKQCYNESWKLFKETHKNLLNLQKIINDKNKNRRMPYTACCIDFLQSSPCL